MRRPWTTPMTRPAIPQVTAIQRKTAIDPQNGI